MKLSKYEVMEYLEAIVDGEIEIPTGFLEEATGCCGEGTVILTLIIPPRKKHTIGEYQC
jgi:hypothetical protein